MRVCVCVCVCVTIIYLRIFVSFETRNVLSLNSHICSSSNNVNLTYYFSDLFYLFVITK